VCGRDCDGDSELLESASNCLMKAIIGPSVG